MQFGFDSDSRPTRELLQSLSDKKNLPSFWCGYIGGADAAGVWDEEAWDLLKEFGIKPLPIYVPLQNCSENAVAIVEDAIERCQKMGLYHVVAFDSEESMSAVMNFEAYLETCATACKDRGWTYVQYAGSHYVPREAVAWNVKLGHVPDSLETDSMLQYVENSNYEGILVDEDVATEEFPFATFGDKVVAPKPTLADDPTPTPTPVPEGTPVAPKDPEPTTTETKTVPKVVVTVDGKIVWEN